MPQKKSSGSKVHLVVGGCGFLGRYIVEQLLERNEKVRVFDLRKGFEDERVEFFVGNIRSEEDLRPALEGTTTVYNTVSPPHGGNYNMYYSVNVEGTEMLLKVARECGVKQFIHTSSSSVVFNGNHLYGVNEEAPYPKKHLDPYSLTKQIAEEIVLKENGKDGMLTIALRPSGIFGPRDGQFFPTLISAARSGKWKYKFSGNNKQDFTCVENVAHAHLLAADKLMDGSKVAGQVYFITNDEPVNPFDIIGTAYERLGFGKPYISLPTFLMWYLALFIDFIVWILSPIVTIHPDFSFFRIATVTANRYFDISKAKKDLGYKPIVSLKAGIDNTIKYFKEREQQNKGNQK